MSAVNMQHLRVCPTHARTGPIRTSAGPARTTRVSPLSAMRPGVNAAAAVPLTDEVDARPVDPVARKPTRQKLRMRIDGQWYDASGWAAAHPGGRIFVRLFDGRDATDVFYALHSYGPNGASTAADRLAKLPKCDPPAPKGSELLDSAPAVLPEGKAAATSEAFQSLRVRLEQEGWFKRDVLQEAWALAQVLGLCIIGTALAWSDHPVLAILSIGLGMEQAGWLGHDYIHGRGPWCTLMRRMPALINGHSSKWWAEKHNLHHTWTNHEGLDRDVGMEPVFFLRPPSESDRQDSPLRKLQHIYGVPLLSIIFWLWRYNSATFLWKGTMADGEEMKTDWADVACMVLNYAWLAALGPAVAIGSVSFAGFLVGNLVTATHQCEDIMPAAEGEGGMPAFDEFVDTQFRTTRDAETVFGPLETWIWGGMDTQLEHHLFPSMPRYRYHALRPVLKAWAKENGVNYRSSPSTEIIKDNWALMKRVASVPSSP